MGHMHGVSGDGAHLSSVTRKEAWGARIQERLDELGIKDREFYAKSGIDRKTLRRAVAGEERVRVATYDSINAALDRLEANNEGIGEAEVDPNNDDYVEFTVEGNFGVRAVVKGPVRDMDELQRAVARLVREMRTLPEETDPS